MKPRIERLLALGLAGLLACHNDATGPSGDPLRPSFNSISFSASLTPARSDTDAGPVSLGSIANPTLVEIKVVGVLARSYSAADVWYDSSQGIDRRGEPAGDWDAGGHFVFSQNRCYGNVTVAIGSGGKAFCDAGNSAVKSVWADTVVASGAATALWSKGPLTGGTGCDVQGKPECFTFEGSHTVSITAPSVELTMAASRYVVFPGKASVTFTSGPLPKKWGRFFIPFNTQRWTWTPDAGGAPLLVCQNTGTCTWSPSSSGTMTLTAIVNGESKSKSVHIRRICEPTGHPMLDSLPILDALRDAWNYSNASSPDLHNRRERSGYVFTDSLGQSTSVLYPDETDTPCSSLGTPTGVIPGQPRAGVHTQPFSASDSLPPNCRPPDRPYAPGEYGIYDAVTYGGPSAADIQRVSDDGVPQFILDHDRIYYVPLGTTKANAKSMVQSWPRVDALGCQRI